MAQLMIMPAVPPPKDATSQIMRGNVMPPVPVRMMIAAPSALKTATAQIGRASCRERV